MKPKATRSSRKLAKEVYLRELFCSGHDLKPSEYGVLMVLLSMADTESRECWPQQSTIAAKANVSLRSTNRAMSLLKRLGYVHTVKALRDGKNVTVYRLLKVPHPLPAEATPPMAQTDATHGVGATPKTTKTDATHGVYGIRSEYNKQKATPTASEMDGWERAASGAKLTGKWWHPETGQPHPASEFPELARENNRPELAERVEAAMASALGGEHTQEKPTQ